MLQQLDTLRERPKPIRARIAFMSAVGATCMIALVWAVTLPGRFSEPEQLVSEVDGGIGGMFSRLGRGVASVIGIELDTKVETDNQPSNVLDVNALMRPPAEKKTVKAVASATSTATMTAASSTTEMATGTVIMIGTTTALSEE